MTEKAYRLAKIETDSVIIYPEHHESLETLLDSILDMGYPIIARVEDYGVRLDGYGEKKFLHKISSTDPLTRYIIAFKTEEPIVPEHMRNADIFAIYEEESE